MTFNNIDMIIRYIFPGYLLAELAHWMQNNAKNYIDIDGICQIYASKRLH